MLVICTKSICKTVFKEKKNIKFYTLLFQSYLQYCKKFHWSFYHKINHTISNTFLVWLIAVEWQLIFPKIERWQIDVSTGVKKEFLEASKISSDFILLFDKSTCYQKMNTSTDIKIYTYFTELYWPIIRSPVVKIKIKKILKVLPIFTDQFQPNRLKIIYI